MNLIAETDTPLQLNDVTFGNKLNFRAGDLDISGVVSSGHTTESQVTINAKTLKLNENASISAHYIYGYATETIKLSRGAKIESLVENTCSTHEDVP
jgi:hypothetical protein